MMDTVLNIGLNDATVEALAKQLGQRALRLGLLPPLRADVRRRRARPQAQEQERGRSVRDASSSTRRRRAASSSTPSSRRAELKELVAEFKAAIKRRRGHDFPDDPMEQLWGAIGAVFGSWKNDARRHLSPHVRHPHDWGTAVNVQAMVFGNLGDDCATGVAFTRDPSTGERRFFGEYLINAQGEDVVAGIRTPQPINIARQVGPRTTCRSRRRCPPPTQRSGAHLSRSSRSTTATCRTSSSPSSKGKLWMLQTRNGKRTAAAAVRIAVDMVDEGLITADEAVLRVDAEQARPAAAPDARSQGGQDASSRAGCRRRPGAAVGKVVFHADDAEADGAEGRASVVLVRVETSPEDIHGMNAAAGHPHRVRRHDLARGRRGARHGQVLRRRLLAASTSTTRRQQLTVAVDGKVRRRQEGRRHLARRRHAARSSSARCPCRRRRSTRTTQQLMGWVDERAACACAPTPTRRRTRRRRAFGAEGIGLCRTEHMFFDEDTILAVRADDPGRHGRASGAARSTRSCPCSAGLRRHLPRHERAAGHDPPARSAAARVPAARSDGADRRSWRRSSASRPT